MCIASLHWDFRLLIAYPGALKSKGHFLQPYKYHCDFENALRYRACKLTFTGAKFDGGF